MKKLACLLVLIVSAGAARAQSVGKGFTLQRYEPTPAGEWSFSIDHPWYSKTRQFLSAGLTLDYNHDPLVFGTRDSNGFDKRQAVIEHQLSMHFDVSASFLDRVNLSFSIPLVLMERGTSVAGVTALSGVAAGDPRFGLMVRLWGQPLRDAFSIHLGAFVWVPISGEDHHAGDSNVRFTPKLVMGGFKHHVLWSLTGAYQYRPNESLRGIVPNTGTTVGQELQVGAAIAYADMERRFAVGPEAIAATTLSNGASNVFRRSFTSLELLLGFHYNIAKQVQLGLAGGMGFGHLPGTPDARAIFRIAYAPLRAPERPLPPSDRDRDGVLDKDDQCPDEPKGDQPDAAKPGCPLRDRDHDGVLDVEDQCPGEPKGEHPDPKRVGCPDGDQDKDGFLDSIDLCPDIPAGPHPDQFKLGCPDTDKDGDGFFDSLDQCPDVPSGLHPDPIKTGCPLADRDSDQIPDEVDACPDKPGAPDPDPKKNGCPGLVILKGGRLVILSPVFFATNKDVILAKSFPVLQAVANALLAQPEIKRMSVEGHTDAQGKPEKNLDLSERRAASVRTWLIAHQIEAGRLEAHGFGQTKPIASNATASGRAANRRVEFVVLP